MKLFDAIGDFLKTLFVPSEAPEKKKKPGAQTHGGFSDGFQKAASARVNLTGVAPAVIVVPEEKPDLTPQPDNDFVASLDDLPLDAAPASLESVPVEPANAAAASPEECAPVELMVPGTAQDAPAAAASPEERAPVELMSPGTAQEAPASAAAAPSPEERAPVERMALVTAQEAPAAAPSPEASVEADGAPVANAVPADAPGENTATETPLNDAALRQGELP